MLKIRLMRIGAKQRPFYRVVAVDERAKRTGAYIELLGTYNPLTEPKEIKLKQDRIDHWTKMGAQPSVGYLRIIGKAPQRKPQKPKKEKKETPKQEEVKAEKPAEETAPQAEKTPEAPVESPTVEQAEEKSQEPQAEEQPKEEKKDEGSA